MNSAQTEAGEEEGSLQSASVCVQQVQKDNIQHPYLITTTTKTECY